MSQEIQAARSAMCTRRDPVDVVVDRLLEEFGLIERTREHIPPRSSIAGAIKYDVTAARPSEATVKAQPKRGSDLAMGSEVDESTPVVEMPQDVVGRIGFAPARQRGW